MKKVSVIVPVYNSEKYLRGCLDSLMNQTLSDIEILAVNDGSTDASQTILEEYQKKYPDKLRIFRKENGGLSSARNYALPYATGEYIGYVDSDDYVDTDMFRAMYETAAANACDAVACDAYQIENNKKEYVSFGVYPDHRKLFINAWVSACNKIIRRSIYEESGIRFPEGYIYEDTAWFAEMIPYLGKVMTVQQPFYYYLTNRNSIMTAAQGKRTGQIFPVMNGVLDFYRERNLFEEYRAEVEYFYIRILFLSSLRRISQIADKQLRHTYVCRTLDEVREHFPNYKNNPYLKGWRGAYIKASNGWVLQLAVQLYRIKYKLVGD